MTDPTPVQPVDYASARPLRFASIAGGVALLFAGLAMILLGGCFLIGILDVSQRIGLGYSVLALRVLPWVLYALAFACFGGAVWLIVAGVRWLYRAGAQ